MILNSAEYLAWLTDPATVRCILVEVSVLINGTPTTLYLSNRPYITEALDTPSNVSYIPIISSSLEYTETLTIEDNNSTPLSYGDISLDNTTGEYDEWLTYVWAAKPINIYVGDVTWSRDTFVKFFSGTVSDIGSSSADTINISIRDVLQRLNTSVTDVVLGNYGTQGADNVNKNSIRPLVFGEVHNITPLLIDSGALEYMVHNGPIESIIEVRDNGVPIAYTPNLSAGTFTINNPAVGTITCSVQGEKVTINSAGAPIVGYGNTVARIIQRLVTGYGNSTQAFAASEMDLTSINQFNTVNPQPVGIYITTKTNLLATVQELASSVGAQLVATREGKLKLIKLDLIGAISTFNITPEHIFSNSLSIQTKIPVRGAIKLAYCKNWTIQDKLITGIPTEHRDLYAKEWLTVLATDSTIQTQYNLSDEPTQKDTLMISNNVSYVTIEAGRLLELYKTPRFIYTFNGTRALASVALGDIITLYYNRFGLNNGKLGQVVSVSTDWNTNNVTLGVLV